VLETVRAATGQAVPYELRERRAGDPARVVGRVDRIAGELGRTARHDLNDMIASAWAAEVACTGH
jgi:UDP-glucose 4-epimerase